MSAPVPDLVERLSKGAIAATTNAALDRKHGWPASAALWDQFAANMEEAAAEIIRLRGKRRRKATG